LLASAILLHGGCSSVIWQARFRTPAQFAARPVDAPFVKCHLRDGRVYLLQQWTVDRDGGVIRGTGTLFDAARRPVGDGPYTVPLRDLALVETNRPEEIIHVGRIIGFTVVGL